MKLYKLITGFIHFTATLILSAFALPAETQEIISRFGVDKFGAPPFFPDDGNKPEALGL